MGLNEYRRKRDFNKTSEPKGGTSQRAAGASFVVQMHAARQKHYDFRLELDGVLLSWAVPKGPSLDPAVKRLAVQTEDHPLEYGSFEGVIPRGEYGGGTVAIWDYGTFTPEGDLRHGLERGRMTFELHGKRLKGSFHLVRTTTRGRGDGKQWLLFKSDDSHARRGSDSAIVDEHETSAMTGRTLAEIANAPDRVWHSNRQDDAGAAPDAARGLPKLDTLAGAVLAPMPAFVAPQLATPATAPPKGRDYLHEIKLDGYRMLCRVDHGAVRLMTRKGNDWTGELPSLARVFSALAIEQAIFDGEVVVFAPDGTTSFARLVNALGAKDDAPCVFVAFDLLYLQRYDLRALPLSTRKQLLHETLRALGALEGRIRYGDHFEGDAEAFLAEAQARGLEGIVSKRASSPYRSKRDASWQKIKCWQRQEFVIGGYTEPSGARGFFGALLLGEYDAEGHLRYVGKVGTGFSERSLEELHGRLHKLERSRCPFEPALKGINARGAHFVEPELVAQVSFAERTRDGILRHPSFQGLRADKAAREVIAETAVPSPREDAPAPHEAAPSPEGDAAVASAETSLHPLAVPSEVARVRLTHPDRVLFPEPGITKAELALYYAQVARFMLPYVAGRPLMLLRCPQGLLGDCFHQKHPSAGVPRSVLRPRIREKNALLESLAVEDATGLLGLVQVGGLEIHAWGSRVDTVELPDQLVFDLDPDEELPFERVIEGARFLRTALTHLGLGAFVKTTGGKGLHVLVPIEPELPWEQAKAFCKALVETLVRAEPDKYLANMSKRARTGKVFFDYLRNGRGATAVCVYSTRAKPGAPVSVPLFWEELTPELRSDQFKLRDVPRRLAQQRRDPWHDFAASRKPLSASILRAVGVES